MTQLQLMRIDFPDQYEDMITKIQLQVQAKATREYVAAACAQRFTYQLLHPHVRLWWPYGKAFSSVHIILSHYFVCCLFGVCRRVAPCRYEQKVVGVLNDLAVLTARNAASVAVIGAEAERAAATTVNAARAKGLVLQQRAKAEASRRVADTLGLTGDEVRTSVGVEGVAVAGVAQGVIRPAGEESERKAKRAKLCRMALRWLVLDVCPRASCACTVPSGGPCFETSARSHNRRLLAPALRAPFGVCSWCSTSSCRQLRATRAAGQPLDSGTLSRPRHNPASGFPSQPPQSARTTPIAPQI